MPQTSHRLIIPDWHPVLLNRLLQVHWGRRSKLKRLDKDMIAVYAHQQEIPKATGKRRVSLVFTLVKGQRRFDRDAPLKSLLDALVAAGLLRDDSPKWCELGTIEYVRGEQRQTEIVLEDV